METINKKFNGTFKAPSGDKITAQLFVMLFADGDTTVAYCPAINVYGYGSDEEQARASFEVCLDEFFTYTLNKGTLFVELEHLGWHCKSKHRLKPPTLAQLITRNKEMSDIWNNKNFTKFDKQIAIPASC